MSKRTNLKLMQLVLRVTFQQVYLLLLTSTYVQEDGKNKGYDYSREEITRRIRTEYCITRRWFDTIAFSSGMAATTALFQDLNQGDHVIFLEMYMVALII